MHELSATIAAAPAEEIDTRIEEWLSKIVLGLNVDRGTLWERDASDDGFIGAHWWARSDVPGLPRKMVSRQISPWATARILAGDVIVYSSPEELPKEEVKLRRFLKIHGPRAQVMLPLEIGGSVVGALTFGKFRAPRHWSSKEVQRLRIIGQIIAGALDRRRAILQARQLREELMVASRRSTMGELTASIAHELNRPLGAILSNLGGLARLLSQSNPKPVLASTAVRNAIDDTKRAGEIVRRFRSMFKAEETRKEPMDIRQLVIEVVKLAGREAASREISLRLDESNSLLRATGDRIQIQQCVLNLLMNALDAAAQSKLRVREVTIRVAREKDSGWIEVSVSDTGTGVNPSVANRIFEPFVTTKPEGMGLGLLVTRTIVESHGGRIWFTSSPDSGSTFSFTLPIERSGNTLA